MRKIAVILTILLLTFGASVAAEKNVKVPFNAVKSSCYGQIDMSKAEFSLLDIGKNCVKESWLEENLTRDKTKSGGETDLNTEEENTNKSIKINLDKKPISELLPPDNVHGLEWDYQDELIDFHLEKRKGAEKGVAGHWSNPGDFSPGTLVRLFRYKSSNYAQSSKKVGFLENADHHKETASVMGIDVDIYFGIFHNEDYSTTASANIE